MSRPLRIQYLDAWYHVMNRGRHGEAIYHDSRDYSAFIELLQKAGAMWKIRVAAYCLMTKHYHFQIQHGKQYCCENERATESKQSIGQENSAS